MSVVQFNNVSFSYGFDDKPVLNALNFSLDQGSFVAVIGSNGSGKSTMAKHINALLLPTAGNVLTVGIDTSEEELLFEIRSRAGMVFQNPDSQIVSSVVADDVAFGPENLAIPFEQLIERVDSSLETVKMSEFKERNPAHLSGGQKQRCCIAAVLAMKPDVLILDEPCAMLDVRGRRGIRKLVRELNQAGITVILITHFMEEAAIAKQVIVMDAGKIILIDTPEAVFSNKVLLRNLNLSLPFSLLLSEALIERGVPVSEIARPAQLKEELCRLYLNK